MTGFVTINPATEQTLNQYSFLTDKEIDTKLQSAHTAFNEWKLSSFDTRSKALKTIAGKLADAKETLATLMVQEMGKPIVQARAEIDKCIFLCEYYAENAKDFLQPSVIESDASYSFVQYDPLGTVLGIMPWNFPVWQVMRYAVPAIAAGNSVLLKPSPNVIATSYALERVFQEIDLFPKHLFQVVCASVDSVASLIESDVVCAVNVTASEATGSAVGALAGKNIKKSVLELGGSDAFIVMNDADIAQAASIACTSRLFNSGQTCISAKRFIVHRAVYDQFIDLLTKEFSKQVIGDPLLDQTTVGPMARKDLADFLLKQVEQSVAQGAVVSYSSSEIPSSGFYVSTMILENVTPEMPVFSQETFGPVAAITQFTDENEMISLVNNSRYGLAATIFTGDTEAAMELATKLDVGHVAINGLVKSDPRLPFGGVKKSGYGIELGKAGLLEFTNAKTIWA